MLLYVVPCLCRWTWGYYMLTPQKESAKRKKRTKTAREKWALTINGERLSDSLTTVVRLSVCVFPFENWFSLLK